MKGQTQQVFIYIMVIIIVGAVLLFGYKSIDKLMRQTCDVDQTSFQIDIKNLLDDYSSYGDEGQGELKSPCQYEMLCFTNYDLSAVNIGQVEIYNTMMFNEVVSHTGNNIFLIKGKDIIALRGHDNLVVPGNETATGFLCVPSISGKFYFKLDGMGKGQVRVSSGS